jgi:hypothetical protein
MEQLLSGQDIAAKQATAAESYATKMAEAAEDKGKIICTELHRQGLMTKKVFEADQAFGKLQDMQTIAGYHLWAKPIVNLMKKSKVFTWIVHKVATPWAEQMAFEMGVMDKPNTIGAIMMRVGIPVCSFIGSMIAKREKSHGY